MSISLNLAAAVARAAARHPDAEIHLDRPSPLAPELGTRLDVATFAALVQEVAGGLAALVPGAQGERIVIAKANHLDIQVLAAAAIRIGAVPVLLSALIPPDQIATVLGRARPAAIVADAATVDRWSLAGSPLAGVVVCIDEERPGTAPGGALRGRPFGVAVSRHPDLAQLVTHTSGTTGVPKLVVHSTRTLAERVRSQTMPIPIASFRRRDRIALAITWNHARAADGLMAVLAKGSALLAIGSTDPDVAGPLLEAFRPTLLETMPNVYLLWERLTTTHPDAFRDVRGFLNAFDAIHPRTVRVMLGASRRAVPVWAQAYGQSEAGGITLDIYTRRTVADRPGRTVALRSMGWKLPGMTSARVTDRETGQAVGPGVVGQFEVRSKGISLTYLGQEDLHDKRRRGEWWTMGDIGTMSRTGRLVLLDRDIDAVPGVDSCLELEDRLIDALDEITEVVVVAHPMTGRAIPVVCTVDDEELDLERWARAIAPCAGALDPPVHLAWAALPRTATFKVRRAALSALLGVPAVAIPVASSHAA